MTEGTAKRVSVKIFESTRDLLEKEKMRFSNPERPDYAEIIAPAVERHLGHAAQSRESAPTRRNTKWHELLDVVLENGTPDQRVWLTGNLQTFAENIEMRSQIEGRKAKRKQAG